MKVRYAIICSARSGSTHLCSLLRSTKRAGNPDEYFNPERYNDTDCSVFSPDYVECIIEESKTKNNVFGTKVVDLNQLKNMEVAGFEPTHYIWLRREDQVLQAISLYKAWYSGVWEGMPGISVPYDENNIRIFLKQIKDEEKIYTDFFREKKHLEIWYNKDLTQAPEQVVISILNYIGVNTNFLPPIKSTQEVARNKESEHWKQTFLNNN